MTRAERELRYSGLVSGPEKVEKAEGSRGERKTKAGGKKGGDGGE